MSKKQSKTPIPPNPLLQNLPKEQNKQSTPLIKYVPQNNPPSTSSLNKNPITPSNSTKIPAKIFDQMPNNPIQQIELRKKVVNRIIKQVPFADTYEYTHIDFLQMHDIVKTTSNSLIYSAQCTKNKLDVVIKAIQQKQIIRLQKINNVQKEIEILSKLNHPYYEDQLHVNQIFEFFNQGQTLKDLLENTPSQMLPETTVVPIIIQLLDALVYLNDENVIHRDITMENILITESQDIKLIDFGNAVINIGMKPRHSIISSDAPQILEGEGHNEKVDVWSIGSLILKLVTGRNVYEERSFNDGYRNSAYQQIQGKMMESSFLSHSSSASSLQLNNSMFDFSLEKFSENLKDLLNQIFVAEPDKRIDIKGVRNHNWIQQREIFSPTKPFIEGGDKEIFKLIRETKRDSLKPLMTKQIIMDSSLNDSFSSPDTLKHSQGSINIRIDQLLLESTETTEESREMRNHNFEGDIHSPSLEDVEFEDESEIADILKSNEDAQNYIQSIYIDEQIQEQDFDQQFPQIEKEIQEGWKLSIEEKWKKYVRPKRPSQENLAKEFLGKMENLRNHQKENFLQKEKDLEYQRKENERLQTIFFEKFDIMDPQEEDMPQSLKQYMSIEEMRQCIQYPKLLEQLRFETKANEQEIEYLKRQIQVKQYDKSNIIGQQNILNELKGQESMLIGFVADLNQQIEILIEKQYNLKPSYQTELQEKMRIFNNQFEEMNRKDMNPYEENLNKLIQELDQCWLEYELNGDNFTTENTSSISLIRTSSYDTRISGYEMNFLNNNPQILKELETEMDSLLNQRSEIKLENQNLNKLIEKNNTQQIKSQISELESEIAQYRKENQQHQQQYKDQEQKIVNIILDIKALQEKILQNEMSRKISSSSTASIVSTPQLSTQQ